MTNTDKTFEMLNLKPEQKFTVKDNSFVYVLDENLYLYNVGELSEDGKIVDYKRMPSDLIDLSYLIKHSDSIIIIPEKDQYTREQKIVAASYVLQGFYWFAKDRDGKLFAYSVRPTKGRTYWYGQRDGDTRIIDLDFPQISWKDSEPINMHSSIGDMIDNTKQNDWIYVKDRVPSEDEWFDKERDCYKNLLICYDQGDRYMVGCYDGYKWMNDIGNIVLTDVVAWKPFENLKKEK